MRAFDSVLIANRGEIACRIVRTARRLGLRIVAVHSTADAGARHVRLADAAVELPGDSAADTYLDIGAIVAAARARGAGAVHPGYGFLSENPELVDACEAAGLVFVGPSAAAMRAMGLKDAAKALMEEAGVPVVPGYHGEAQDPDTLAAEAAKVGYPVLIKARAGGGGKGMRRVDDAAAFGDALAGARREAAASFGDDRVLIEKYVSGPRHVEVQVFGDAHGRVVHLFERDCSLQRRHQKVIEESPAPGISAEVREAMTRAAIRAAEAVGYVGAGTVEFIADGRDGLAADRFWFMEMNTRLQVEHPVTEAVTGLDLVEWQFRVAAGEPLPLAQHEIRLDGHAIEARLYAEDVPAGFLPATGRLERLVFPEGESDDVRVDAGVIEGDEVLPFYDPMLAKLIAHGRDRAEALGRLERALADTVVLGTVTNRDFLLALCRDPEVRAARLDTRLIEHRLDALLAGESTPGCGVSARTARALSAVLRVGAALHPGAARTARTARATPPAGDALSVRLGVWQLWGTPTRDVPQHDAAGDVEILVVARTASDRWRVTDALGAIELAVDPTSLMASGEGTVGVAGVTHRVHVVSGVGHLALQVGERAFRTSWPVPGLETRAVAGDGRILAPMPGRVIEVACAAGDAVVAGQALITLEAMKMEHALGATADGTVERVRVAVGDQVAQGDELLTFAPP